MTDKGERHYIQKRKREAFFTAYRSIYAGFSRLINISWYFGHLREQEAMGIARNILQKKY